MNIKPSEIYFTHSTISYKFTGCGKFLDETLNEIINGTTKVEDIPKIKVFYTQQNGTVKYFSENNRRLWLFKHLEKLGLLDTVEVRIEKTNNKKYIKNTYSLEAKVNLNKKK